MSRMKRSAFMRASKAILRVMGWTFLGACALCALAVLFGPAPVVVEPKAPTPAIVEKTPIVISGKLLESLTALIAFDGAQFTITNGDSFDWTEVTLEVNAGFFSGGYYLHADRMNAKTTYTVGAMQFAKSNGERFNPLLTKLLSCNIVCHMGGNNERHGFFYETWK